VKQAKVLVTGSQGYVGTELVKKLRVKEIEAVGLDSGFFLDSKLDGDEDGTTIKMDLRNQRDLDLKSFKSVIHLAGLSNDPLGEINPLLTYTINRDCAIELARKAKSQGVERFIFVSTQSIYGISNDESELSEEATKNPITAYAKSKWDAEQEILGLRTDDFTVTAVRPSTIFGWGSRIRNDIIFNNMIASGIKKGKIEVHTNGQPYRPVIHISDVTDFLILLLSAPAYVIRGQAYNLGMSNGNYKVLQVAEVASKCLGDLPIILNTENQSDPRSYKVSFEKAKRELGYVAELELVFGGYEILSNFQKLSTEKQEDFFNRTVRIRTLQNLIDSGRLKPDLTWV